MQHGTSWSHQLQLGSGSFLWEEFLELERCATAEPAARRVAQREAPCLGTHRPQREMLLPGAHSSLLCLVYHRVTEQQLNHGSLSLGAPGPAAFGSSPGTGRAGGGGRSITFLRGGFSLLCSVVISHLPAKPSPPARSLHSQRSGCAALIDGSRALGFPCINV